MRPESIGQDFFAGETEQLRAELNELKVRHREFVNGLPVGIIRVSSTGFVEYGNRRAEAMLGGRLTNQRMARFVQGSYQTVYEAALDAARDGEASTVDLILVPRKGPPVRTEVGFAGQRRGEQRKVVLSLTDTTRTSAAVEAATQASNDVRQLIQFSASPVVVLNVDGIIELANERAQDLLATRKEALEGQPFERWVVETSLSAYREQVARRGRGPTTVELVRGGQARRVRLTLVGVRWKDEGCLAAMLEDVTEQEVRLHQDEREGRLASLGLLVAGVAHEVNNPLAFIIPNVAEVSRAVQSLPGNHMIGSVAARDAAAMLDEAGQGLERIANIARDLKGFHRTDSQIEALSVNEVIVDTLRLSDSRLRQSARVRRDLGALPPLNANRGRLGQVVLNLLINAAGAMPEGRPRSANEITVRTWLDAGVIHLQVGDNGRGIPKQHLSSLFDPFFTTRQSGTGLGLAICTNIVRDLGGWIEVESEQDVGTRFVVCFPLAKGGPRRVLVISDQPLLIRGMDRRMRRQYALVQACGFFEAIRILQEEEEVEAVLSARNLREGSGDDVYDWIRRHRPTLLDRFVFMGDNADGLHMVRRPLTAAALDELLAPLMR